MHYVYVLRSKRDNLFYTGVASNLKKRIEEHQNGRVRSTRYRTPFALIYYEACLSKEDAFRRERYLKTGMGKRYLRNRLRNSLAESAK